MDNKYSIDKKHVCKNYSIIKGADPETFEVIDYEVYTWWCNLDRKPYRKDKKYFYWNGKKIEDIDPKTFKILKYDYSIDKNNVYWQGKIISKSHPETFEILTEDYARDRDYIYNIIREIEGGGAAEIGSPIIVVTIKGVDVETFEIFDWGYSKDKSTVYYRGEIVKDANPKTFKIK